MNETGKEVDSLGKMKNDFALQLYINKEQKGLIDKKTF